MRQQNMESLLRFLACVHCDSDRDLEVRPGATRVDLPFPVADRSLHCAQCSTAYPVSGEGIPIMWDTALEQTLLGSGQASAVSVNVELYNRRSSHFREPAKLAVETLSRFECGIQHLLASASPTTKPLRHLDFGCGAGPVIRSLAQNGSMLVSVGLDVSIESLRLVLRDSEGLAVLGNAERMPFKTGAFDLVTEYSVLHHIPDWREAVREACRVCEGGLGVILASEPSKDHWAVSPLARAVFEARFHVYRLLSYVDRSKMLFRDLIAARRQYYAAEIHNQPGAGFDVEDVRRAFGEAGFRVHLIHAPGPRLEPGAARQNWKHVVLHVLSLHNPWDPRYAVFWSLAQPTRPA